MDPYSNPNMGQQPAPFMMTAPPLDGEEESGFDFWGVLNRRKWLVFLGLVCGMGLATLFYAKSAVIYESTAFVKIEPKDRFVPISSGNKGLFPEYDEGVRHDRFMSQENIINKMFDDRPRLEGLRSFDDYPSRDDKISYIQENLQIGQDKEEPTLYQVTYQNSLAKDSPAILNALIDTYKQNLVDQYSDQKSEIVDNLRKFDEEYNKRYDKEFAEFDRLWKLKIEQNLMVQNNVSQSQLLLKDVTEKLGETLEQLKETTADRERILAAIGDGPGGIQQLVWQFRSENKMPREARLQDSGARILESIQLRIGEAEDDYRLRKTRFGDGHPTVEIARDQLTRLRASLDEHLAAPSSDDFPGISRPLSDAEALDSYRKLIDTRVSSFEQDVRVLKSQQQVHAKRTKDLQKLEQQIDIQKDKVETLKEMLNQITQRFAEITPVSEDESNDDGYRVQPTQVAGEGEKVWPILPLILGVGGLLGSMAGFGLGCLVELADKTFHNPDEIMRHLNVPLIGHIPVITQGKRYLVEGSTIEPTICTYHRPKSQTSEAFRAVRTALYFNTQGKQHSVIQVTSPTPGDGKSTLASNLSVSIAQSGKRVLLVDADMRRPRQHSVFGIEATEGFATVLSGRSAWRDCVYECEEIEGLTLMPCGKKPQNPAELCSSPQVKDLIGELREEFDFVIIDTPPLLAVTDAGPIAARVDGVILTLRIKKNVRVSAERAAEMLQNIGANCIGLVVNGVGAQSGYGSQYTYGAYRAGYSYNGYGYGYGYGQGYGVSKYYEEDKKGRKVAPRAIEVEETREVS